MTRKNIKVDEELFERLKADKGTHRSWPQYFEDQLDADDGDTDDTVTLEASERTKLVRAIADELAARRR